MLQTITLWILMLGFLGFGSAQVNFDADSYGIGGGSVQQTVARSGYAIGG
jgi:hypothetical protein